MLPVQERPVEAARVRAVPHLEHAAQCSGQTETARDHLRQERRCRGDEPYLVALREVLLGEGSGLRPHGRLGGPNPDVVRQLRHVGHRDPGDHLEPAGLRGRQVQVVLTAHLEPRVLPPGTEDVAQGDQAGGTESARQVERARSVHEGVVQVEEREDRGTRLFVRRPTRLGDGAAGRVRAPARAAGSVCDAPPVVRHVRRAAPAGPGPACVSAPRGARSRAARPGHCEATRAARRSRARPSGRHGGRRGRRPPTR